MKLSGEDEIKRRKTMEKPFPVIITVQGKQAVLLVIFEVCEREQDEDYHG